MTDYDESRPEAGPQLSPEEARIAWMDRVEAAGNTLEAQARASAAHELVISTHPERHMAVQATAFAEDGSLVVVGVPEEHGGPDINLFGIETSLVVAYVAPNEPPRVISVDNQSPGVQILEDSTTVLIDDEVLVGRLAPGFTTVVAQFWDEPDRNVDDPDSSGLGYDGTYFLSNSEIDKEFATLESIEATRARIVEDEVRAAEGLLNEPTEEEIAAKLKRDRIMEYGPVLGRFSVTEIVAKVPGPLGRLAKEVRAANAAEAAARLRSRR